ncbi:MAG: CoA transferase [Proteobacteria bacterium]|nr:CoA transferase [Pseudomonadota bacterium]
MNSALSGLRIIELGGNISAPYCCKLLADLGADAVKIEHSDVGDPLRSIGAFPNGAQDTTIGALFRYLNANKSSIAADLKEGPGIDAVLKLIVDADIVVENLGPGVIETLGLGFAELKSANPHIVLVRISDFGQDGPFTDIPATDLTVQAASGWVSNHGAVGRSPVMVGGEISDYTCGAHAACASLTAFRTACQLETAVCVDVSKQECLLSTLPQPALRYKTLESVGLTNLENQVYPVPGVVPCKDGLVGINVLTAQHFADCCNLLGTPEYIPKQYELMLPGPELDAFYRDIRPWLMDHTMDQVVDLCQAFRIPACPVTNGEKLLEIAQLRDRSFYVRNPEGDFIQPSFPYRLEKTPATTRRTAPRLGENHSEVAKSCNGYKRSSTDYIGQGDSHEEHLPMQGIRVLDLGIFWAGPYVSCYLGAMGAEVIKIESIQRPDAFRYQATYPHGIDDWYEKSWLWQGTNLNKRDLTLDLSRPEGKAIIQHLIAKADILIENFSPRVMDNFGLGTDYLNELNPALIVVRMPGFGLGGPWKNYVGWAMSIEQASGIAWVTGSPEDVPLNPGGFADPVIAMHALVALQAALHHRDTTGEAQAIEVAQLEVAACLTAEQVIAYSKGGRIPTRNGNRSDTISPQGVYMCADDNWVAISIRDDIEWGEFVAAIGSPNWAVVDRFSSYQGRREHRDELDQLLSKWSRRLNSDIVIQRVRSGGVPVAKVLIPKDMYDDPHLIARDFYQEIKHPRSGNRRYAGWPMRQSPGPKTHHRCGAPTLGEHNTEILREELGLSNAEIEELINIEIIGNNPKGIDS